MLLWWIIPATAIIAGAAFVVARLRRPPQPSEAVPLANTEYVEAIPAYRRLLREYRILRIGAVVALIVALAGGATLAARQSSSRSYSPEMATRDIVLCLDVSASMRKYDIEIVDKFANLSENFTGERISLIIFDATASTIFPLTDDYALVRQELQQAKAALAIDPETATGATKAAHDDYLAGTIPEAVDGSSLIGDGIASCSFQFDNQDKDRSRSIVLATDNEDNGDPIFTLTEAMDEVKKNDIHMYAMYAPGYWGGTSNRDAYQRAVQDIGGLFYRTDDAELLPAIIDNIEEQEVNLLAAAPQTFHHDEPMVWFIIALVGLAGIMIVGWRLEG